MNGDRSGGGEQCNNHCYTAEELRAICGTDDCKHPEGIRLIGFVPACPVCGRTAEEIRYGDRSGQGFASHEFKRFRRHEADGK